MFDRSCFLTITCSTSLFLFFCSVFSIICHVISVSDYSRPSWMAEAFLAAVMNPHCICHIVFLCTCVVEKNLLLLNPRAAASRQKCIRGLVRLYLFISPSRFAYPFPNFYGGEVKTPKFGLDFRRKSPRYALFSKQGYLSGIWNIHWQRRWLIIIHKPQLN